MIGSRKHPGSWRALTAVFLLAVHAMFATGLLPWTAAALAWLDGHHRVLVHSQPGITGVVLAHDVHPGLALRLPRKKKRDIGAEIL